MLGGGLDIERWSDDEKRQLVAETWPDIASVEGLKAHAAEMGSGRRARFITCPPDWGCNIINANMLRAAGVSIIVLLYCYPFKSAWQRTVRQLAPPE